MRITFELATPLILNRQTYFDGLLAWCAVKEADGDLSVIEALPLKQTAGVYHASTWVAEDTLPFVPEPQMFVKNSFKREVKSDPGLLDVIEGSDNLKKNLFNEGSGRFKGYLEEYQFQTHRYVHFWACGDVSRVEELLDSLRFLGAKSSLGMGKIKKTIVEPQEHDTSLYRKNRIMRPLPVDGQYDFLPTSRKVSRGYSRTKPPYWEKTGLSECFLPEI
jgi:hypothetical protein